MIQLFVFLQDMFYKCTNCMQFWQVYEFEKITSCFIFIELFVAHSLRELDPACAYTHAQGCPRNSSRSIFSLKFFIRKNHFLLRFLNHKDLLWRGCLWRSHKRTTTGLFEGPPRVFQHALGFMIASSPRLKFNIFQTFRYNWDSDDRNKLGTYNLLVVSKYFTRP